MRCSELGGVTTVHTQVCSNNTYWTNLPCTTHGGYKGRRCNSEYSGQCYYPDSKDYLWFLNLSKTCRDRSHDIMPLPKNGSCPPTHYFSCLVNKKESCISEAVFIRSRCLTLTLGEIKEKYHTYANSPPVISKHLSMSLIWTTYFVVIGMFILNSLKEILHK